VAVELEKSIVRHELELRKQAEGFYLRETEVNLGGRLYKSTRWCKPYELQKATEMERLRLMDQDEKSSLAQSVNDAIESNADSLGLEVKLRDVKDGSGGGVIAINKDGEVIKLDIHHRSGDGEQVRVWYKVEDSKLKPLGDAPNVGELFRTVVEPFLANPERASEIWQLTAGRRK
jgi:hypothetical protein